MKTLVSLALGALLASCSGALAGVTELINDDLRPLLPSEVVDALGPPSVRVDRLSFPDRGRIEVRTTSAATDEGGLFLLQVEIHMDDSDGWDMGASRSGGPVNRGDETGLAAQMSQSYLIARVRDAAFGTERRETMIEVSAAGAQFR